MLALLSPRSAFSILSHQHKSVRWQRMRPNAHRKQGSVCTESQCARRLTHGDWPLAATVWFLFVFFPFYVTTVFLIPLYCLLPLSGCFVLTSRCPALLFCGITAVIKTMRMLTLLKCMLSFCVSGRSEQTRAFVRCQSRHPEAMFSSWTPPSSNPVLSSLLCLFFGFFAALPLGHSTRHTPHIRLSKRRMWRNMWV